MMTNFKKECTIMLPVHRSNLPLANECIKHLLDNSDLNIIVIDDYGKDEEYVNNERIKFIHNNHTERQPLVKIWNQCIKECPTEYVIIASWRQRPTPNHFTTIENKLKDGYGLVSFDGLHFFGFSKHLTTVIGFFDEGFTKGQYEDSDWWHRLRFNNIGIFLGQIPEQRNIDGKYVGSMWLDGGHINAEYYHSKWVEDKANKSLIQNKQEVNISDREIYRNLFENRVYKKWKESELNDDNMKVYDGLYDNMIKKF